MKASKPASGNSRVLSAALSDAHIAASHLACTIEGVNILLHECGSKSAEFAAHSILANLEIQMKTLAKEIERIEVMA